MHPLMYLADDGHYLMFASAAGVDRSPRRTGPTVATVMEEVFGPVLSIIGFDDEADALRIANDTIYGLAGGVWTSDIGRAVRMSSALKVGTVWVNTYRAISYMMPFGGMKKSGIGRESGVDAIKEYLETKSIWLSYAAGAPANPFIMR